MTSLHPLTISRVSGNKKARKQWRLGLTLLGLPWVGLPKKTPCLKSEAWLAFRVYVSAYET